MGIVDKAGNLAFKVFTAGLGVATVYLTATFSVNVYRGLAWHNEQKMSCDAGVQLELELIGFGLCILYMLNWMPLNELDSEPR
uniref:Uncharacterized protein n=1 Tax=Kalanchoe fedtschenkoi TaxID=63787 RepID=A0A7N0VE10_KALFE